jgi:hypothetical protein
MRLNGNQHNTHKTASHSVYFIAWLWQSSDGAGNQDKWFGPGETIAYRGRQLIKAK